MAGTHIDGKVPFGPGAGKVQGTDLDSLLGIMFLLYLLRMLIILPWLCRATGLSPDYLL